MGPIESSGKSRAWLPAVLFATWFIGSANLAHGLNAGDTVTTNVVLDQDITTNVRANGLVIGADNITIDGNGHTIKSARVPQWSVAGISLGSHRNVTIKNCTIEGFWRGISGNGNTGIVIDNCRLQSSILAGIHLDNPLGIVVTNSHFTEPHTAMTLQSCPNMALTFSGNKVVGGRAAIIMNPKGGAPQLALSNNQFLHQVNENWFPNGNLSLRMSKFGVFGRQAEVGSAVNWSTALSSLDGGPADVLTCTVRTIPEEPVAGNRIGNTVAGSFVPTRRGLYSVLSTTTDPNGNCEIRAAKIQVGPIATRTLTYFLYGQSEAPFHGPGWTGMTDQGGMNLAPPPGANYFKCTNYLSWWVDTLPPAPIASISKVQLKTLFSFDSSIVMPIPGFKTAFSLDRIGKIGPAFEKYVDVSPAMGTKDVKWGEFEFNNLGWPMDYQQDWYYMTFGFQAINLKIYTGNPIQWGHPADHLSRALIDYGTTTSPEVQSLSNPNLLVLGATSTMPSGGGEVVSIWGVNQKSDLTLANFRRPFLNAVTTINSAGFTVFSTGIIAGETAFAAAPLEVAPTQNAVSVQVLSWPETGEGPRAWTESALGAPGSVSHKLYKLGAGQGYQILANGGELTTGFATASGEFAFTYTGQFPATFSVNKALLNHPPVILSYTATPNPALVGQPVAFAASASDPDGDAIDYLWEFGDGGQNIGASPSHSYTAPGTYIVWVTAKDGKGGNTKAQLLVTIKTPTNLAPTITSAAAASPNPVTGTSCSLTVLGADDGGVDNLTYTWAVTGTPPAPVSFSANGTNAAKISTATFSKAGSYTLQATVRDVGNLSATSTVTVIVKQTLTTITVTPANATVPVGGTLQFSAAARDQFGIALTSQPVFIWTLTTGSTLSTAGLFTAGTAAVTATAGGKSGTAYVSGAQ